MIRLLKLDLEAAADAKTRRHMLAGLPVAAHDKPCVRLQGPLRPIIAECTEVHGDGRSHPLGSGRGHKWHC